MLRRLEQIGEWTLYAVIFLLLVTSSSPPPGDTIERARAFTRPSEFNYDAWTLDAALLKLSQASIGLPDYMSREARLEAVMEYLRVTERALRAEERLAILFADPAIEDKEAATAQIRAELEELYARAEQIQPIAESVIQSQVTETLAGLGLALGGQPIPPVLYHVSSLPMNLIVSRRDRIEQIAAISLQPELSLDQQVKIEDQVAAELDASTLVVPVGGIGVYPTMVMRTDYFEWQVSTVVHEWTHNFLTLRPLGINYATSPELRTMNETVASIVENEVGPIVMARFYRQLTSASPYPEAAQWTPLAPSPLPLREGLRVRAILEEPSFDFRAEMHATRVRADELLAAGKIEEAEAYMEQRRQFFWDHGYAIRKLNQAYFAFYGAYADVPGGPAGEDPVGPAVRKLREQSASLADFLNAISWMTSFQELLEAVGE
jgi:hypothetical protein